MGTGDLEFVGSAALAKAVAHGLSLVRALVTTVLAVRLFGTDLYGLIAYGLSAVDIIGSVVGGLPTATLQSVTRMRTDSSALRTLFGAITVVVLLTGVVGSSLILALLLPHHGASTSVPARLVLGLGLGVVLMARFAANQAFAVAQAMRRVVAMEAPRFLLSLCQTGVVVALWASGRPSIALFGAGLVASGAIGLVLSWVVARAVMPTGERALRLAPRHAYGYSREGVPYALSGMAVTALVSFDVVGLGLFRSSAEVGHYQPAMRIESALLASPLALLSSGFVPAAIGIHRRGSTRELFDFYAMVSKFGYAVTFPFAVVLAAFPVEIVQAIVGKHNAAAPDVVWVLIAGSVFELCFGINTGALVATGARRAITVVYTIGLAAMVTLTLVLVPLYGQLGAAIAFAGAAVVLNVSVSSALYRETRIHPFRRDMLGVTLSSFVAAAAALLVVHQLPSWSTLARMAVTVGIAAAWFVALFATRLVRAEDVLQMVPGRARNTASAPGPDRSVGSEVAGEETTVA